ncbi:hypothetical protein J2800_000996 [Caulobacter rhizosphaerae]|uniref:Uncharacterized protein n=1 Tax=Caulobacter rhizosphaerae TaxID=2010972 RepID=A0ABU1MVP4_9CAUL|nr:hypothetical protein [Caulobacter rhizosphaerae]MDR6530260.1 hypothetical protein [Caulobacter rhizosphaerae]
MATTDEQKAIWHVLRLLRSEGEDWSRHNRPTAATAAVRVAEGKFTALDDAELKTHLIHRGRRGQFDENQVVFIRPPAKDPSAVAGVWCRWDYEKTPPRWGFYYGLWSAQPPFPKADPPTEDLHTGFVGYRFETPEDGDNHNFYHVQPCRSMGAKDDPIEHAIPISQRDPTWPLAADSALELLMCLVTSLYGMKGLLALQEKVHEDLVLRKNTLIIRAIEMMLGLRRQTT